jgi:acyl carrier protein
MTQTELWGIVYLFIYDAIQELFPRTRNIALAPETSFKQDLNLDSLDGVDFLLYIEEHFGQSIIDEDNEEEKAKFQKAMKGTIADMLKYLAELTEQKGSKWE